MDFYYNMILKTIYMVIVFTLACINLPVKDCANHYIYYYSYLKFGTLIYYSLQAFKTPDFVMSLGMMIFAVVCKANGFRNSLIGNELRVVGLVMTLGFIIKFIIIDIQYESSVLKALRGGMLCFAISAIYNYFEKKQKSKSKMS